jgi:hypothetical protein
VIKRDHRSAGITPTSLKGTIGQDGGAKQARMPALQNTKAGKEACLQEIRKCAMLK